MPWFKVDDGFTSSRKVISIPRQHRLMAIGLWTYAGNFSARELTDGFVPTYVLDDIDAPAEIIDALVTAGLWDRVPDGIQFHDWCEYQPSAADYRAKQEETARKRSVNGSKGAAKRWSKQTDSKPMAKGMAKEWQTDSPEPEPEPEPVIKRELARVKISPDYSPHPVDVAWAKEHWPLVDWEAETAKFLNYFISEGAMKSDWDASWRGWILNRAEQLTEKSKRDQLRFPDGAF